MTTYKEYKLIIEQFDKIDESELLKSTYLLTILLSSENINSLNEGFIDTFKKYLDKLGLEVDKETGLFDLFKKYGVLFGNLIVAGIKNDKNEIKKISQEIKKEDFLKFVYNLDMLTMHLLTGPIHAIAAVTGWEIKVKELPKAKSIINKLKTGIEYVKDGVDKIFSGKRKQKIMGYVHRLEKDIPVKTV